ncbi:hypothetical protein MKEN_00970400 [Mycena kentingensis (nom. inval.)]|nr:hypothetical protein MKEN_00970400 [Mycena kentingensis (nom. inval.)]
MNGWTSGAVFSSTPMSSRRRQRTPDSPERDPLADVHNLIGQLTPSTSPRRFREIRSELQLRANDAAARDQEKDEHIVDLETQALEIGPPRKRRRLNREADAPPNMPNAKQLLRLATHAGRRFAYLSSFFFYDESVIWTLDLSPSFDPVTEFENSANRNQGQLREIQLYFPAQGWELRGESALHASFSHGVDGNRTLARNRMRGESLKHFTDDPSVFDSSDSRFDAFAEYLGYHPSTPTRRARYSVLKAEYLYDEFDGTINLAHLFRGHVLLKIGACLIRGPDGAQGLFDGASVSPQASTIERRYGITHTTPGFIANCAILALFLFSADPQFVEKGHVTKINYRKRHIEFSNRIRTAMAKQKGWVRDLFPTRRSRTGAKREPTPTADGGILQPRRHYHTPLGCSASPLNTITMYDE